MTKVLTGTTLDCIYCGPAIQTWSTPEAAKAAAAWHVYAQHRDVWNEAIGDRAPLDPKPETLGERWI